RVVLRQRQLRLPAVAVEQAQDDLVGDLGGNRKPRAAQRWRRPQRERRPRPHLSHRFHQPLRQKLLPAELVALLGGLTSGLGCCYHHSCRLAHRSTMAEITSIAASTTARWGKSVRSF